MKTNFQKCNRKLPIGAYKTYHLMTLKISKINGFLISIVLLISGCFNSAAFPPHQQTDHANQLFINYPIDPKHSFGLFEVTTFDVYVSQDTIHLLLGSAPSTINQQRSIYYTRSEDGGHQWSIPVNLGNHFPPPLASRGNDIQIAASGNNLLAIWQTTGELPGMGPMVSAYSNDGGKSWWLGSNPAANNFGDQSHIDLAVDHQGNFHSVWLEDPEEHGYQSLNYAKTLDNGMHWESRKMLDDSTCSCCWNTLIISPEDELFILYRDMKPRDMALGQILNQGTLWKRVSTVGNFNWQFEGCPHVGGGLSTEIKNFPVFHSLVWTGSENMPGLYYLRSFNRGQTWSKPLRMGNSAIHGDIVATKENQIAAVWDEMEPDGTSIFYSKSINTGDSWSRPLRLSQTGNLATHPKVTFTRFGLLAIWTEKQPRQPSQLAITFLK